MTTLHLTDYDIFIGPLGEPFHGLLQMGQYSKIAVLTDGNTHRHCLPYLLQNADFEYVEIGIPPGELYKNLDTCQHVWAEMMRLGLDRRSLLVNLGGGVTGDLGGFCATTYLRGIDFVQIPTSLLSQVDASVGGKVGIDFQGIKNSIGVFQNPKAVLVDPVFLKTLPPGEVRSGFAEILKHALISDRQLWQNLKNIEVLDQVDWTAYLTASLAIKKVIVETDPLEKGIRKALNFGHTIGHAVESFSLKMDDQKFHAPSLSTSHPLSHGEAVALGTVCESWLSWKIMGLPEAALQEIVAFVRRFFPPYPLAERDFPALLQLMKKDKKNNSGRINFTLLTGIGEAVTDRYCGEDLIVESLNFYRNTLGG